MSFLYPAVLFLLVVPFALLVWIWRRKGHRIAMPFDHGRPGRGLFWWIVLEMAESLPALVLAVVIIMLAGPQWTGDPQSKRKLTNIELAIDISGSMTASFGGESRYDVAMKSLDDFLDFRKGDAVGLTFFGHSVLHWCPLTSDSSAIRCAPPFMRPENVPPWFNGTAIAKALRSCKQVLIGRQEGERMVVLLTDGESFDLQGAAEEIASDFKKNNITVFAIIIGMDRIQDEIVTITSATGGEAFEAGDPDALKSIFHRIDQMTKAPIEKKLADTFDWFFPFCIAGLSLLGLGILTAYGLRYTPW